MLLYHGSNIVVDKPVVVQGQRALDFGKGFYLTSSKEQALRWSRAVTRRRNNGTPSVSIYEVDESSLNSLNVLRFESANAEWLEYVVRNRRGDSFTDDYDVVIGPVANDSTFPVIDDYMAGVYTAEEAVRRLLPQNLTDHYTLKSTEAVNLLKFKEVFL